jgi:site-specific recombinase XerD
MEVDDMLTLYKRHKETCPNFDLARYAKGRACKCKWWADGTLNGEEVRFSLKTRDEKEAYQKKYELENAKPGSLESAASAVTLADAWTALLADLQTRVSFETRRKYKTLKSQMTAWGNERGLTMPSHFTLDSLSQFRQTWKDSQRTASKKVERLRAFFTFCVDRGWCETNPATKIKLPKVSICPTMPLTPADMVKILTACDGLQITAQASGKLGAHRLKTLILLMRYTGVRISDAVSMTTDRLDGKRLFLYTAKTGVPVYTVLPDSILKALEVTPRVTETRYFWSGNGKRETAVCDYQEKMKKAFEAAGISKGLGNAVSHRFRDTFAVELLLAGVPIERVSILLGHQSVKVTEKHYNPWVRSRQEQLEADVSNAWKNDAFLAENLGTNQVQFTEGRPN